MTQQDLQEYQNSKRRYIEAKERLAEFEMTIYYSPSPTYDGMPKSHGDISERLSAATDRHEELINAVNVALLRYINAGRILDQVVAILPIDEGRLIEYRYRQCLPWKEAAENAGYVERSAYHVHQRILRKIQKL